MINWIKSLVASSDDENPYFANQNEEEDSGTKEPRMWIAVDLDGTLAEYTGWQGISHIGKPIPQMKQRVLEWISAGIDVKIFTARASVAEGIAPVAKWLQKNGFPNLEVTNRKDFQMIEMWDDRAVQVIENTGKPVLSPSMTARPRVPLFENERAGSTFELARPASEPEPE